jgi:hypothetical protein
MTTTTDLGSRYDYLTPSQKRLGPFSLEQLNALANKGVIRHDTLYAPTGTSGWQRWGRGALGTNGSAKAEVPAGLLHTAWAALKLIATNPVAGVPAAVQALGDAGSLRVGLCFGAGLAVSLLVFAQGPPLGLDSKELLTLKTLLTSVTPYVCLAASLAVARLVGRGQGNTKTDCLVAGAASLPLAFLCLAARFLGIANVEVILVLTVFALCLLVLILYSGCHRVAGLSERASAFCVPVVLIAAAGSLKVWLASMIRPDWWQHW